MMDDTRPDTFTSDRPQQQPWMAAPPQPVARPPTDWEGVVRKWLIVLTLVVLSLSLLTALIAANQAISTWLQPQYAPFVRFAAASVVAAAALVVVLRLTRRR